MTAVSNVMLNATTMPNHTMPLINTTQQRLNDNHRDDDPFNLLLSDPEPPTRSPMSIRRKHRKIRRHRHRHQRHGDERLRRGVDRRRSVLVSDSQDRYINNYHYEMVVYPNGKVAISDTNYSPYALLHCLMATALSNMTGGFQAMVSSPTYAPGQSGSQRFNEPTSMQIMMLGRKADHYVCVNKRGKVVGIPKKKVDTWRTDNKTKDGKPKFHRCVWHERTGGANRQYNIYYNDFYLGKCPSKKKAKVGRHEFHKCSPNKYWFLSLCGRQANQTVRVSYYTLDETSHNKCSQLWAVDNKRADTMYEEKVNITAYVPGYSTVKPGDTAFRIGDKHEKNSGSERGPGRGDGGHKNDCDGVEANNLLSNCNGRNEIKSSKTDLNINSKQQRRKLRRERKRRKNKRKQKKKKKGRKGERRNREGQSPETGDAPFKITQLSQRG